MQNQALACSKHAKQTLARTDKPKSFGQSWKKESSGPDARMKVHVFSRDPEVSARQNSRERAILTKRGPTERGHRAEEIVTVPRSVAGWEGWGR